MFRFLISCFSISLEITAQTSGHNSSVVTVISAQCSEATRQAHPGRATPNLCAAAQPVQSGHRKIQESEHMTQYSNLGPLFLKSTLMA